MPGAGSSRRSGALGVADPRGRRDAQARTTDDLQCKDPLFYDNDGKLTADPAAFRTLPGFKRRAITASYVAVKADELIALVRDRKGAIYAPKSVEFLNELPLTAVGKPDKKVLRARYWGDRSRHVN